MFHAIGRLKPGVDDGDGRRRPARRRRRAGAGVPEDQQRPRRHARAAATPPSSARTCARPRSCSSASSASCSSSAAPTWPTCCWRAPRRATRELAIRAALGADRPRAHPAAPDREPACSSLVGGALGLGARRGHPERRAVARSRRACCRAAVTLTFDLRVVAFCAAAALVVGLLFGLAPAWQATAVSSAQALAVGQPDHHGRRRPAARPARGRRSGDGGPAAGRRRPAAAHAAGGAERRSRLSCRERADDDGGPAGVASIRHPKRCCSSSRRSSRRCWRCPACAAWPGPAPCRSGASDDGPVVRRDRRRSAAGRRAAADGRLPDREPHLLPDARSPHRRRPRLRPSATRATACRSASSTRPSSARTCTGGRRSGCASRCGRRASAARRCARSSAWPAR